MKTKHWDSEILFIITKALDNMINDKELKTVVSFALSPTKDAHCYSAILIYK